MIDTNRKKYSSGESLTELLVAALIISLAMIMLFSGVKVGADIMRKSRNMYENYNEKVNTYESAQADYIKDHAFPEPSTAEFEIIPKKLPVLN